jgi:DNA-binding Xre family transcriptional regulator
MTVLKWRLRMAAAERGVWTAAELRRLLAGKGGLDLSSASVSALFTGEPAQLRLTTLAALCTALECTPDDLLIPMASDEFIPSGASTMRGRYSDATRRAD